MFSEGFYVQDIPQITEDVRKKGFKNLKKP